MAYTVAAPDPLADDEVWARRTVKALGNVAHEVIPHEQMPLMYDGVRTIENHGDEPVPVADINRWLAIVRRAARRGSRMHLTGVGGDELLYGSVAHLHGLIRRRPIGALRLLRGFMAKYRWEYRPTMAQLRPTCSCRWRSSPPTAMSNRTKPRPVARGGATSIGAADGTGPRRVRARRAAGLAALRGGASGDPLDDGGSKSSR